MNYKYKSILSDYLSKITKNCNVVPVGPFYDNLPCEFALHRRCEVEYKRHAACTFCT